jgi:hypothetical protein
LPRNEREEVEMTNLEILVASEDNGNSAWFDMEDYTDFEDFMKSAALILKSLPDYLYVADQAADYDLGVGAREVNSLETVWETARVIGDAYEPEAMASYLSYYGWDLDYAENFEEAYCGKWDSLEDYAIDFYEDVYGEFNIPGFCIEVDLDAWECDYFTVDTAGGVHVFRSL